MTREELKEMVDATINGNGTRNITGDALNLALNAIIDSMGEQKPESAGMVKLVAAKVDESDPTQLAIKNRNIEIFNELKTKFFAGETLPMVQIEFHALEDYGEGNINGSSVFIFYPCAFKIYEDKINFGIPGIHPQVEVGIGYYISMPNANVAEPAGFIVMKDNILLSLHADGSWSKSTFPLSEGSGENL